LLRLLGAEQDVTSLGGLYLRIAFLCSPFMFLNFISAAALRGAGDTRNPMRIGIIMNSFNIFFGYSLI
jgi:Na+-driven multidrug efflux pump